MRHASASQRRIAIAIGAAALAALATGCSSNGSNGGPASHTLTPPVHSAGSTTGADQSTPTTSTDTQEPPSQASTLDLSGSWSGHYQGAYSGTFHLTWVQHGKRLTGTITLSAPASTDRLTGTVNGSAITFGTLGSQAVTYSGTASGGSMSGSYQVAGTPTGNWSATKSS